MLVLVSREGRPTRARGTLLPQPQRLKISTTEGVSGETGAVPTEREGGEIRREEGRKWKFGDEPKKEKKYIW